MVLLPEADPGSPEKPAAEVRQAQDPLLVPPRGLRWVRGLLRVLRPVRLLVLHNQVRGPHLPERRNW